VQNLVGINSAVTMLNIREMSHVCVNFVDFFVNITICFFFVATGHSFVDNFSTIRWVDQIYATQIQNSEQPPSQINY